MQAGIEDLPQTWGVNMTNNLVKQTIDNQLLMDARRIIENARQTAVRSVDFCRYRCTGLWDSESLRRNKKAKTARTMVHIWLRIWQNHLRLNTGVDFLNASLNIVGSFIACTQLGTRCVPN